MGLLTLVGRTLLGRRKKSISSLSQYSLKFQHNIREKLVYKASKTEYGKKHSFNSINSYVKFSKKIPVVDYEDFFPQIRQALSGRENIIWPGKICWFAKSSGTTNDQSKYILDQKIDILMLLQFPGIPSQDFLHQDLQLYELQNSEIF